MLLPVGFSVLGSNNTSYSMADVNNISDGEFENSRTSPVSPETKPTTTDVSINALQRIIQKIDEGPPPLPSICQYSLLNAYQGYANSHFVYILHSFFNLLYVFSQ